MDDWFQVGGIVGAALGGIALFLSALPPGWYGATPGDSYVFDPPAFSPLWIDRVLLPALAVVGTVGLLVGFAALLRRDWRESTFLRWGGVATLLGGGTFTIGVYGPDLVSAGPTTVPTTALAGLALALWGVLLSLVGVPLVAFAYLRAGNRRLGWGLLAAVPVGLVLARALPEPAGALAGSLAWVILGGILAWDLRFGSASGTATSDL